MNPFRYFGFGRLRHAATVSLVLSLASTGCIQPNSGGNNFSASAGSTPVSGGTSTSTTSSTIEAFKILMFMGNSNANNGSFDPIADTTTGAQKVKRLFDPNGNVIATASIPSWFSEAYAYVSEQVSDGCAYFDTYADGIDHNPGNSGYYTIDGYYNPDPATPTDVDKCAPLTGNANLAQPIYIKLNRSGLASTDKISVIVTARPIDEPNTTQTPSACTAGGYFSAANCVNQLYGVSIRPAPFAQPSFSMMIFPSAKARDLTSEQVLLPLGLSSSITTISIDRQKGGAVFYELLVMRIR